MMEEYDVNEERTKAKPKMTCSFSIERILRKDDKHERMADRDETRGSERCELPVKILTDEYEPNRSPPISPCRSYPVCPHPVCPVPTNPLAYPEPLIGYYSQKSFPSYLSMTMLHKGVPHRGYYPSGSGISYVTEAYSRQIREKGKSVFVFPFISASFKNSMSIKRISKLREQIPR